VKHHGAPLAGSIFCVIGPANSILAASQFDCRSAIEAAVYDTTQQPPMPPHVAMKLLEYIAYLDGDLPDVWEGNCMTLTQFDVDGYRMRWCTLLPFEP
jgi:hypothetical protein